ncbi:hypothetical protein A2U01_0118007, partial [Trifolium medium]|nr:hypothetical protein [Trifolium medium]
GMRIIVQELEEDADSNSHGFE